VNNHAAGDGGRFWIDEWAQVFAVEPDLFWSPVNSIAPTLGEHTDEILAELARRESTN